MRTRQVASGDVTLAVSEWGDPRRPTIVMIHGYPDTSAVWWPVAERLADRFHVVAYDVRGAGGSSTPRHTADYRLELLVGDLAAVIGTGPPVHLVGHDWGSIQGWEAVGSQRLAGRIASFTSLYAPGLDHAAHWARDAHIGQLLGQLRRSWYVAAFHLPGAGLAWRMLGHGWAGFLNRVEKVPPSPQYPAASITGDAVRGLSLYRANLANRLARPAAGPIGVPTLVIVPRHDRYVSPALSLGLGRWVPTLWRTEIAAGHWAPRTHPGLVAGWIGELVDHVEGAPASRRLQRARVSSAGKPVDGKPFDGQVVVVTGAGRGIGRATALAFAERGAAIVAADINGEAAARTAALAGELGAHSHHRQVDVGDAGAMEDLAGWVGRQFGTPDIVVNNAGIGMAGPMLDTTVADWDQILKVNLWGVIHGTRLFGRQMADGGHGGHIVNVASMAAYTPSRSYPAYAATKAAVLMLGECLRAELADADIGVHTICPGFVTTGIGAATRHVGVSGAEQDRLRKLSDHLYRRALKPEAVAAAVLEAVRTGAAVVPVGRWARFNWSLAHLWPRGSRRLARVDLIPR